MTALWIKRHREELIANSRPMLRRGETLGRHGTQQRYAQGCRCAECIETGRSASNRRWFEKHETNLAAQRDRNQRRREGLKQFAQV